MAYAPMDISQIFGMVSYLHILTAFAVILHLLLKDVPIPDDVLHEMTMQSMNDHNLPSLTGKHQRRSQSQDPLNFPKMTCIRYEYKHAEGSVSSHRLGEVSHFPDNQFKCTFRIECHTVDRSSITWLKKIAFGSNHL